VPDNEKGLTFLFQGDSITDGNWGRDGGNPNRNLTDLNHYLGHGYVWAIASRLGADFPQAGFRFHNRGVGGQEISDLEKRWQKDAVDIKPDVLGILIGVNDVLAIARNRPNATDAAAYAATYERLLTRSREANPNVIFVLGVPFLYPVGNYGKINPDVSSREILKHAAAVRGLAQKVNAVLVDYPAMFERAFQRAPVQHWIWDGCHPSAAGHELMACEWISQLSAWFAFLKKYKSTVIGS
jgi:lysophospholipase L1-like esterase